MHMDSNPTGDLILDRYLGTLLGVAVGDALGAPLEFMSQAEILSQHHGKVTEMIGGGWLHVKPGEVTDDTQMTLAVAEGIAQGKDDPERYLYIGDNFLKWYAQQPKDVGNTCASVLGRAITGKFRSQPDWERVAKALWEETHGATAGNGALMRTAYPAIYCPDPQGATQMAIAIGRMTHYHPDSDATLKQYVQAINIIANHPDLGTEEARQVGTSGQAALAALRAKTKGSVEAAPSGWSVDSLLCAYAAIGSTTSFEGALVEAVNLGGDADTIGAITGGLAGAIYGASAIPRRWVEALDNAPNARTVQLFAPGREAGQPGQGQQNALARRLEELAAAAYAHSHEGG